MRKLAAMGARAAAAAYERKRDALMSDTIRLLAARVRLGNLSWLMRCLAEPIARAANAEDDCKGRFWEGRYKAQVLCDDRAVLAAMAYLDPSPIRGGMASDLMQAHHTGAHAASGPFSLKQVPTIILGLARAI